MTVCELCGKSGPLFSAIIEGSSLSVCSSCARHGKVVRKPVVRSVPKQLSKPEVVETVVDDYAQKIHGAREAMGLSQKDFAARINEKESFVQKLESGSLKPSIDLARKLERLLKIKLVDVEQEESVSSAQNKSGPLTIGDLIKLKK